MQAAQHKTLFLAAMLILGVQPLAAHTHVAQNSRLGIDTFKTSLHQEIELGSSLKALEIDASVRRTCVRSRSTGKERDEGVMEAGMDYFGARYLSAGWGRIVSADAPFADQHGRNPQTWNLYSYGRNNSLRFVDEDGRASVEYLRRKEVRLAREQERDLVRRTNAGTTSWTDPELKTIKEGGWSEGYFGHHINNVHHHPELAGEPRNVRFMNFDDHMAAHNNGNTRLRTTGALLNRGSAVLDILQSVIGGLNEYREAQITGVMESTSPFSFGETIIVDPNNAAQTLDGAVIRVGGANGNMYRVSNGEYLRFGCVGGPRKCRQSGSALTGSAFEIVDPDTIR